MQIETLHKNMTTEKQEPTPSLLKPESDDANRGSEGTCYEQNGKHGIGHMSGGEIKDGAKVAGVINEVTADSVSGNEHAVAQVNAAGNAAIDQSRYSIYYYNNHHYYPPKETSVAPVETAGLDETLPCLGDAEFFFGQTVFVSELVQAAQTRAFIPVLGASGSGKLSVVLKGLELQLQKSGHWQFTHFRPGSDPFNALARALVPLYLPDKDDTEQLSQAYKLAAYLQDRKVPLVAVIDWIQKKHPNQRVLLIADQFEELYTPCPDEETRRAFLDCLLASLAPTTTKASPLVVVATMREDSLGNALSYHPFADMLQKGDVKFGAMNRDELCEVIEQSAATPGVTFESGLVKRIPDSALHEFALTKLWAQYSGGRQSLHEVYLPLHIRTALVAISNGAEYHENNELAVSLSRFVRQNAVEFWQVFELTIKDAYQVTEPKSMTGKTRTVIKHSNIECCNKLFKRLGYAAKVIRVEGKRGSQVKIWTVRAMT